MPQKCLCLNPGWGALERDFTILFLPGGDPFSSNSCCVFPGPALAYSFYPKPKCTAPPYT